MDVIEYLADRVNGPLSEAIDKIVHDPEVACELKSKMGSIAPISIWKLYRMYLVEEETKRNRAMAQDYDTVKLCYN